MNIMIFIIRSKVLYFFLLILGSVTVSSQSFISDSTFQRDRAIGDLIRIHLVQPDGKILIAGNTNEFDKVIPTKTLARLNTDGSIDNSFNLDTLSGGTDLNGPQLPRIFDLAIQPDGKILIAGTFIAYGGVLGNGIFRLNTDGSLDPSFNSGIDNTFWSHDIQDIEIQPDGKILLAGSFRNTTNNAKGVMRLNMDGSADASFNNNLTATPDAFSVAIQNDGKIIIGGDDENSPFNGFVNGFRRVNADGTTDVSFDATILDATIRTLAIESDGKILVGGRIASVNGVPKNGIVRLLPDGTIDPSFTANFTAGAQGQGVVYAINILGSGHYLVGGFFSVVNNEQKLGLVRLNLDGSLDPDFSSGIDPTAELFNARVETITVLTSESLLLSGTGFSIGTGTQARFGIARIISVPETTGPGGEMGEATGEEIDSTFNPNAGTNGEIKIVIFQEDGKILIGGDFTSVNNTPRNAIARLNANGTLDATFDSGTGPNASIFAMALTLEGKILIGGDFTSYNGTAAGGVARINLDGSIDNTFSSGTGVTGGNARVLGISAGLNSNYIFLVGDFNAYDGSQRYGGVQLNADGTIRVFAPPVGVIGSASTITGTTGGGAIVGGIVTPPTLRGPNATGSSRSSMTNRLIKFRADGSVDPNFMIVETSNTILSITTQKDGKLLITGAFSTVNNEPRSGIARLFSNGVLDTSFNPGTGATGGSPTNITQVIAQSDGTYLIGGSFTVYGGTARTNIARLNNDGSLDISFAPALGLNAPVQALAVQADGRIVLGGAFTMASGSSKMGLVRLGNNGGFPFGGFPGPEPIPTLSEWGLLIIGLLVLNLGVIFLHRMEKTISL